MNLQAAPQGGSGGDWSSILALTSPWVSDMEEKGKKRSQVLTDNLTGSGAVESSHAWFHVSTSDNLSSKRINKSAEWIARLVGFGLTVEVILTAALGGPSGSSPGNSPGLPAIAIAYWILFMIS